MRNLLGANMSFRRSSFSKIGGFRDGVGRTSEKRPLGCEETEYCIRLRQHDPDSVILFDPAAVVYHSVGRRRCQFSYFHSRCFAEGLSKAVVAEQVGPDDGLSTERRYIAATLPRGVAVGIVNFFHGDWWGLARSGAIIYGLSMTACGYFACRLRRWLTATELASGSSSPALRRRRITAGALGRQQPERKGGE